MANGARPRFRLKRKNDDRVPDKKSDIGPKNKEGPRPFPAPTNSASGDDSKSIERAQVASEMELFAKDWLSKYCTADYVDQKLRKTLCERIRSHFPDLDDSIVGINVKRIIESQGKVDELTKIDSLIKNRIRNEFSSKKSMKKKELKRIIEDAVMGRLKEEVAIRHANAFISEMGIKLSRF